MRLLIDIGNTSAKWVLRFPDGCFGEVASVAYRDAECIVSSLQKAVLDEQLALVELVAVASVAADGLTEKVCQLLADDFLVPVVRANTVEPVESLRHCYMEPAKLGVDRWLVMVAVAGLVEPGSGSGPEAVCVADLGTAATIDVVAKGLHQGGVIVPGEALMVNSLLAGAAQISDKGAAGESCLGTSTGDAVAIGARQSSLALLNHYRQLVANKWPAAVFVLTGGGAKSIEHGCAGWEYRPHLVFEGLSAWVDLRG